MDGVYGRQCGLLAGLSPKPPARTFLCKELCGLCLDVLVFLRKEEGNAGQCSDLPGLPCQWPCLNLVYCLLLYCLLAHSPGPDLGCDSFPKSLFWKTAEGRGLSRAMQLGRGTSVWGWRDEGGCVLWCWWDLVQLFLPGAS